jgi:hypothetical protein
MINSRSLSATLVTAGFGDNRLILVQRAIFRATFIKFPGIGIRVCLILKGANEGWSMRYSGSSEIAAYYDGFARRFNLPLCTSFNQNVIKATWSDEAMLWTVVTEDRDTKKLTVWKAVVLLIAYRVTTMPIIRYKSSYSRGYLLRIIFIVYSWAGRFRELSTKPSVREVVSQR